MHLSIDSDIFYYNVFPRLDNSDMLNILLLGKFIRIKYWKNIANLD